MQRRNSSLSASGQPAPSAPRRGCATPAGCLRSRAKRIVPDDRAGVPGHFAEDFRVSRDFDPTPGQWYEDLDREETFKVVLVDPDEVIVRIQWLDGDVEELDLDTWHELDLELADEPEGWVDDGDDEDDGEAVEDDEELDDEDDEDDDWDDDEDDDYDDDDDEYRDRE